MVKKAIIIFVGICVAFFGLIQLVPYGHDHTNPPVTKKIIWDSSQTEATMRATCLDCHSNETVWPWYSYVAPASWLIQKDVEEGRDNINLSGMDNKGVRANELTRQIQSGKMPPFQYTLIHWNAKLSDAQKQQLINGLTKTFPN